MTYMESERERRLDIVDQAEAFERWQQLRAWGQPHSYPVPGVTEDGTPCWTLWRWTGVVNAELAAEARRLAPGPFPDTTSPGSSAKAAKVTIDYRKRFAAKRKSKPEGAVKVPDPPAAAPQPAPQQKSFEGV